MTTRATATSRKKALDEFLPDDRKDEERDRHASSSGSATSRSTCPIPSSFQPLAEKVGDVSGGLAIFLSTAPSLFEPAIEGLQKVGLAGDDGAHRAGKAARLRSRLAAARSTTPSPRPSPRSASSGSTIISARRRCRTSSRCASAIRSSSRCGTRAGSTTSRSRSPRRSGWRIAPAITRARARCATWSPNHMLQLLALIAMEPPARFDGTAIRDEKAKVFRSLRLIKPEEVPHDHRHRPIWRRRGEGRDRQGL